MMYLLLLFVALVAAAPPSSEKLIITKQFFPDSFAVYSGSHDIVEISIPLNQINYPEDDTNETHTSQTHLNYIFFVEADIKEDGTEDYKGLYVYKNGKAKKIMENGQTATFGENYKIYIGASDGIYKYNYTDESVHKFGTFAGSVIKLAMDVKNAYIYYLTSDYVLYKFGQDEDATIKVEAVTNAKDIAFDFHGNMFFYDSNNHFYVYDGKSVVKIEGLPANPTKVALINAPVLINEVYAVIDGSLYEITAEATSESKGVKFEALPTAFAPDGVFIQYYAYNKKIYEYNLFTVVEQLHINDLKEFFDENENEIKTIYKHKHSKKFSTISFDGK